MSIIDKALRANRNYAKGYDPKLGRHPAPKIVVVTCMDPRLSNLPEILGLPHADIDVIRTGGPAVTEDVLGELVVSTRVLGTTEKVRSHPWIAKDVPVRGFVFDMGTGLLSEVEALDHAS
jgi:carbonic anhydrase